MTHTAKGGWAGPGELVFRWGGCIPLAPRPEPTGSYPRGLALHSTCHPLDHRPHSREVQCSASERIDPRGRDKAGVSQSHLSLNSHLGERETGSEGSWRSVGHWKGEVVRLLSDGAGQRNPGPWLQSHPAQPSTGLAQTAGGRLDIEDLGAVAEGQALGGARAGFRRPSAGGRTAGTCRLSATGRARGAAAAVSVLGDCPPSACRGTALGVS